MGSYKAHSYVVDFVVDKHSSWKTLKFMSNILCDSCVILSSILSAMNLCFRPGFQQRRGRGFKEDPYVFLDSDSDVYQSVG